eukprot:m.371041 g.371041  ORF g.371041 m.371041 type:complete len:54 (+) comp56876_c0_seq1:913-1074(+)
MVGSGLVLAVVRISARTLCVQTASVNANTLPRMTLWTVSFIVQDSDQCKSEES